MHLWDLVSISVNATLTMSKSLIAGLCASVRSCHSYSIWSVEGGNLDMHWIEQKQHNKTDMKGHANFRHILILDNRKWTRTSRYERSQVDRANSNTWLRKYNWLAWPRDYCNLAWKQQFCRQEVRLFFKWPITLGRHFNWQSIETNWIS